MVIKRKESTKRFDNRTVMVTGRCGRHYLTRVGDYASDGILPEAAAFDASSRFLAVTDLAISTTLERRLDRHLAHRN